MLKCYDEKEMSESDRGFLSEDSDITQNITLDPVVSRWNNGRERNDVINIARNLGSKRRFKLDYDDKGESFRFQDPVFRRNQKNFDENESIVATIKMKIISGGMDDNIYFGLSRSFRGKGKRIRYIPGIYVGSIGYHAKTGYLYQNCSDKRKLQLVSAGTGDTLQFWITSHSRVTTQAINSLGLLFHQRYLPLPKLH